MFGSELFIPDPEPTSEKFQIRSGAYLTQYGISKKIFHTTSFLFHVWSSIVARRLIVFDSEWLISFFFKKKKWSIISSLISMQEIKMKKSNIKFHRNCFCKNFVIPFYFGSRSKSGCRMHSGPGSGSAKARSSGPIRIRTHNTVTNTDIQAGVEPITNDRKTSGSFSFLLHGDVT